MTSVLGVVNLVRGLRYIFGYLTLGVRLQQPQISAPNLGSPTPNFTVDSKKLECGPRTIYAGFPCFFGLGLDCRMVLFQPSGFYCSPPCP